MVAYRQQAEDEPRVAGIQEYKVREVAAGEYHLYTNLTVSQAHLDKYGFKAITDWKDPDYSPGARVWRGPSGCIIWATRTRKRDQGDLEEQVAPDAELTPSEKKYGRIVHEETVPFADGGELRIRHYLDSTIEVEEDTPDGPLITTYEFVEDNIQMSTSDNPKSYESLKMEDLPEFLKQKIPEGLQK